VVWSRTGPNIRQVRLPKSCLKNPVIPLPFSFSSRRTGISNYYTAPHHTAPHRNDYQHKTPLRSVRARRGPLAHTRTPNYYTAPHRNDYRHEISLRSARARRAHTRTPRRGNRPSSSLPVREAPTYIRTPRADTYLQTYHARPLATLAPPFPLDAAVAVHGHGEQEGAG
jgi:hypothetical protein